MDVNEVREYAVGQPPKLVLLGEQLISEEQPWLANAYGKQLLMVNACGEPTVSVYVEPLETMVPTFAELVVPVA